MAGIYEVLSGALTQEKRLEVITNNLANVNTIGFKRDLPLFETIHPKVPERPLPDGAVSPTPVYAALRDVVPDLSTGPIRSTGEPLDVAIEGAGFFSVQTPQGVRYTRGGSFTLDAQGRLVTQGGFPVLGTGGPITLPPGSVSIDPDGKISVKGTEVGAQPIEVDTLPVIQFPDGVRLKKVGETLFETTGVGTPSVEGLLLQGSLEGSNVNPVEEMISMIQVSRLYESAQKAIQTADELASKAGSDIGKIA